MEIDHGNIPSTFAEESCREYRKDPLPREIVEKLVYAASRAPTACNMPYRHFIVVDDLRVIKSIRQLSPSLVADPPLLIVVVTDTQSCHRRYWTVG